MLERKKILKIILIITIGISILLSITRYINNTSYNKKEIYRLKLEKKVLLEKLENNKNNNKILRDKLDIYNEKYSDLQKERKTNEEYINNSTSFGELHRILSNIDSTIYSK